MAFVRRKKMGGNYYYQLVRNYRDRGKHRQKVLCHLGIYDSIEGAKGKVAFHEEAATSRQNEADSIQSKLVDLYGDDVETYSEEEARDELYRLRWWGNPTRSPGYYARVYGEEAWRLAIDEWEVEMQLADLWVEYHEKVREAALNRMLASQSRAKVNKLLECQQKYCS